MPSQIQQKFYVAQENAVANSLIVAGPFFDKGSAELACAAKAKASVGVPYVVLKTTSGFAADSPTPIALEFFTPAPGEPPLDL